MIAIGRKHLQCGFRVSGLGSPVPGGCGHLGAINRLGMPGTIERIEDGAHSEVHASVASVQARSSIASAARKVGRRSSGGLGHERVKMAASHVRAHPAQVGGDKGSPSERGVREAALAAAIGHLGVWDAGLCTAPASVIRAAAMELEHAGYGAAWLHEGGRDAFVGAAIVLAATGSMVAGTSIVSIWRHEPEQMADAARTLGEAFAGRFVLGIGVGHRGARSWHGRTYRQPLSDLAEYLDAVDRAGWFSARPETPVPRVIGALGPRGLALARARSRGAIPYLVPVSYTRAARDALGHDPVLAVQQAIVLGQRTARARELAHEHVRQYLPFPNYRNNLLRCGFDERELAGDGSERLIDALVAIGDADEVAARVHAHLEGGADHVCVDPLGRDPSDVPVTDLERLPSALRRLNPQPQPTIAGGSDDPAA
jgi:probable F420-dependent oxidoreductase